MFDDADFASLTPDQTARFTIDELRIPRGNSKPLTLLVKHAGQANEAFSRAVKNIKFKALSEDEAQQAVDMATARHVIVGWEDALSPDGSPRRYTPEDGAQLLAKLREHKRQDLVTRLVAFVANAANFTAPTVDPGDLGNG